MENKTYFLVPAYNESAVIGNLLDGLIGAGQTNLVVVNDGSSDSTGQVVGRYQQVKLINHIMNRGQGAALATGLEYLAQVSDCACIVTFDADGQHRLEDALQMVELLKSDDRLDLVIGSRFMQQTDTNAPLIRRVVLKLGVQFLRFVYGLKITDAHNGLRVIRQRAARQMIPRMDDFSHASEMMYLIKHHHLKYVEFPTSIIYSDYSLSKGQHSSNAIKIAIKTIMHKINVLVFE